jgi:molybdate transport system permease protein
MPIAIYFEWMGGHSDVATFWVFVVIVFSFVVIALVNWYASRTQRYRRASSDGDSAANNSSDGDSAIPAPAPAAAQSSDTAEKGAPLSPHNSPVSSEGAVPGKERP